MTYSTQQDSSQPAFSKETQYKPLDPNASLLVFSDLDGTLLDHHSYSYDAAKPALLHLFGQNIPLILNTSKTFTETLTIQDEFGGFHPFVVENGAVIAIPENYFNQIPEYDTSITDDQGRSFFIKQLGMDYSNILRHLNRLRREFGFKFRGFGDMSDEEVATHTGLSIAKAADSRKRLASEPLLWEDQPQRLSEFIQELAALKLTLIQGGRFWHVKSASDKADAMQWLHRQYQQQQPKANFINVALGDSPNDQTMLEKADIAVVIAGLGGHRIELNGAANQFYTALTGPWGWERAIHQILLTYSK